MDFNTEETSIYENPTDLPQSQASSTMASQYTLVDIVSDRIVISDNYSSHDQVVSAPSPCKPTTADDIEIFRQTLADNWCMLIFLLCL